MRGDFVRMKIDRILIEGNEKVDIFAVGKNLLVARAHVEIVMPAADKRRVFGAGKDMQTASHAGRREEHAGAEDAVACGTSHLPRKVMTHGHSFPFRNRAL